MYLYSINILQSSSTCFYFRLSRNGREHARVKGGLIVASNHRSFLDPFVIGCCLPRPIYFVAKRELFKNPLIGWFLNCMGAFPVRRGESDDPNVLEAAAACPMAAIIVSQQEAA